MKHFLLILLLCLGLTLGGCHDTEVKQTASSESSLQEGTYQLETPIQDVMTDPRFEDYGRLLFPTNSRYYSGRTLEDLQLVFYDHIDPNETVAIANDLARRVDEGQTVFYDIILPSKKQRILQRKTPVSSSLKGMSERLLRCAVRAVGLFM